MIQLFIVMLLFTFFALGGMVSDLGFARLAQRQMNTSTDSAALEGLRLSAGFDVSRRNAVRTMVRDHFDDDFNRSAADRYQFGAGPAIGFAGGQTNMAANQQVVVAPGVVYKPDPELNLSNARHGDMVSGFYDEYYLTHDESQTYVRPDFRLAPLNAEWRPAFLVRLRRTNNDLGLDAQGGTSSSGQPLPYLFSRGSMMAGALRTRGITVRGTSIAAAMPATAVGLPFPSISMVGVAPFAFEADFWATRAVNSTFTVSSRLDLGGGVSIGPSRLAGGGGAPVGVYLNQNSGGGSHESVTGRRMWSIGDQAIAHAFGTPSTVVASFLVPREYIFPIYEGDVLTYGPGTGNPPYSPPPGAIVPNSMPPRLIGFGNGRVLAIQLVDDVFDGINQPTRIDLTVGKDPNFVLDVNVSAVETPGLAGLRGDLAQVLVDENRNLDQAAASTRAAALVR